MDTFISPTNYHYSYYIDNGTKYPYEKLNELYRWYIENHSLEKMLDHYGTPKDWHHEDIEEFKLLCKWGMEQCHKELVFYKQDPNYFVDRPFDWQELHSPSVIWNHISDSHRKLILDVCDLYDKTDMDNEMVALKDPIELMGRIKEVRGWTHTGTGKTDIHVVTKDYGRYRIVDASNHRHTHVQLYCENVNSKAKCEPATYFRASKKIDPKYRGAHLQTFKVVYK